jgi:hypothetical protein
MNSEEVTTICHHSCWICAESRDISGPFGAFDLGMTIRSGETCKVLVLFSIYHKPCENYEAEIKEYTRTDILLLRYFGLCISLVTIWFMKLENQPTRQRQLHEVGVSCIWCHRCVCTHSRTGAGIP